MKKINIPVSIQWAYNRLINTLMEYESDTFSASAERLTRKEAETIAMRLVREDLLARIECDTLDGVMITEKLDVIRRRNNY